jgi:hypothetical protein
VEALEAVESRVHTTLEQCLMSITVIARQAQGQPSSSHQAPRQRSYKSQRRQRSQPYSS